MNINSNEDILNYNLGISYYRNDQIEKAKEQYNLLKDKSSSLSKSLKELFDESEL